MTSPQILVVDDSKTARKAVRLLLSEINAEVTEAANGLEAVAELRKNRPVDLVITDIGMPEMDGLALCDHIKNTQSTSAIPVIALSMFDSEHEIEKGFQAGADAYVSKRSFQTSLLTVVKETLDKSQIRRKCLVMIVDDSKAIRLSIESFLVEQGFQVIVAENGREALCHLENHQPDLILSDYEMPIMDGLSLCRAVKAQERLSTIPFVAMSIHEEQSHMKRFIQNGAAAYLTKPFNFNELSILIERIISDHFMLILKERERLEEERNSMLASIASLVVALEARDAYTKGHSEAVATLAVKMLKKTGMNKEELETVKIGATLHDIGKIGVPDATLLNPGQPTEEEWKQIKEHPSIGANILQTIPSLTNILPIVRHHHERYDGNGYPDGLKGDEIPYWARITAVADTFSALTENRPYRQGLKTEKALQIIKEVSGSQLCPKCVEIFFTWVDHLNSK